MKVYVIYEDVDLGYRIHSMYLNKEMAESKCAELIDKEQKEKIDILMRSGIYTYDDAKEFVECIPTYYVEEFDVVE